MRKLVVTEWISLDGFIAGPNKDMSFVSASFNEEMGRYESEILDTADTILLGRVTYESFAGAWPARESDPKADPAERDYAKRLNAKKKFVFSRSMDRADWHNSEVRHGIDADEIRQWKKADGKDMLVYGSASVVGQLTNLGLVDEYQLLIHPVVLGGGKQVFKAIKEKVTLKLINSNVFKSGVVKVTYHPV